MTEPIDAQAVIEELIRRGLVLDPDVRAKFKQKGLYTAGMKGLAKTVSDVCNLVRTFDRRVSDLDCEETQAVKEELMEQIAKCDATINKLIDRVVQLEDRMDKASKEFAKLVKKH